MAPGGRASLINENLARRRNEMALDALGIALQGEN